MSGLDTKSEAIATSKVTRADWMRALLSLPKATVKQCIDDLAGGSDVRLMTLPNSGLGLLKLNDAALNESFFLGEFPLATSSVELTLKDGRTIQGAAQVMNDDADYAVTLAIADALLANNVTGIERLHELVEQGEQKHQQEQQIRKAMLAKTKVDFSLLNMTEEEFDDE